MDLSLNKLKEAISIRTQIQTLEKRLSGIFGTGGGSSSRSSSRGGGRRGVQCRQLLGRSFPLRRERVGPSAEAAKVLGLVPPNPARKAA